MRMFWSVMAPGATESAQARPRRILAVLPIALALSACSSVPGETMSSGGMQREVRDKVLSLARAADPQCRQARVLNTEMLDVHPDGKAAEELWTVDRCGQRMNYVVSFPPRRATGTSLGFSVRQER